MSGTSDEMPTYQRFLLAAELLGISPTELARRLELPLESDPDHPRSNSDLLKSEGRAKVVNVHAKYLGHTIKAVLDLSNNTTTITSGDLAGSRYSSPSSAAIAVVSAINPGREAANTNGRLFWTVTDTGRPLRSLLGQR